MPTAAFPLSALPNFLPSVLYFSLGLALLTTSFSFLSAWPCSMDIFYVHANDFFFYFFFEGGSWKQLQLWGVLPREEQRESLYYFPTTGPWSPFSPLVEAYACAEHLVVYDTHLVKSEVVGGGAWRTEVKSWHWGVRDRNPMQLSLKNVSALQMLLLNKFFYGFIILMTRTRRL